MKQNIISNLNLYFYTNIISYIVKFIWLNALTLGSMKSKKKNVLLTPFIEDGYNRLDYYIRLIVSGLPTIPALWLTGLSQGVKCHRTRGRSRKCKKI